MTRCTRTLLPILLTSLALPLAAQRADPIREQVPPLGAARVDRSGSVAATGSVLWADNMDYVTQSGVGAGGADVSEVEPGLGTFGTGFQQTLGARVADDFTVPAGDTWYVDELHWLAYQTGASTAGSITGFTTEYVAGADPNGAVFAGDAITNRLVSTSWTGTYRVTSSTLTSSARALIDVTVSVPAAASSLSPGQYWVRSMCDGSIPDRVQGPFAPVTVPWDGADNAHQEFGPGAGFVATTDGFGGAPVDYVFWLVGRDQAPGGVSSYCLQSKATSVAGCLPVLSVPDETLAGGSWSVSQVPLGAGETSTVGIFIYTAGPGIGQSTFGPLSLPIGELCLTGFSRSAPTCAPVTAVGTGNSCTSSFSFAPSCSAGALGLNVGDDLNVQCWYRDPPVGGQASFTNAVFYTLQ